MIGIRCERGSHRFFKKYGERFEDSEGKQIFLEFADEEREHLDLLVREYRALVKRQGRTRRARPARAAPPALRPRRRPVTASTIAQGHPEPRVEGAALIDLHLHTTASDGRCTPRRARRARGRGGCHVMAVTDHDTTAAVAEVQALARARGHRGDQRHRDHRGRRRPRRPRARLFLRPANDGARGVSRGAARAPRRARRGDRPTASPRSACRSTSSRCWRARASRAGARSAGRRSRARWSPPGTSPTRARRSIAGSAAAVPASCRAQGAAPEQVIAIIHAAGGLASLAHPGQVAASTTASRRCATPVSTPSRRFTRSRRRRSYHYVDAGRDARPADHRRVGLPWRSGARPRRPAR